MEKRRGNEGTGDERRFIDERKEREQRRGKNN